MYDFKNKIAIVTGSTTGVGEAIALELFRHGAVVIITSRNEEELSKKALQMDPSGQYVIPIQTDVKEHLSVKNLVQHVIQRFGRLDFLVNNAGITGPHGVNICDYTIEDWNDVIHTDISGVFYCMKYAIPEILKTGNGAIVNLSAVNGIVGIAGIAPYTAAKHAIIGLTQSVALEYAEQGIRINAVCPGYVDTPKMKELPECVRQQMASTHPMKRMATREEVAKTVMFLLSDESSFTTGAHYTIDGGYTAQ